MSTTVSSSCTDGGDVRTIYPLHCAVFNNEVESLKKLLEQEGGREKLNSLDVHGRSPIMLATVLGHIECAELLLKNEMWSLSHEAVCLGNPHFLKEVLETRDFQRAMQTSAILRELRDSMKNSEDFYVEMSWEFTSWLPLVKNMCPSDNALYSPYKQSYVICLPDSGPSDTYKIYKRGSDIRIDSTLLALDNRYRWKRGDQSFIFRFIDGDRAEITFVDHSQKLAFVQMLDLDANNQSIEDFEPSEDLVADKLLSPITTTYIDVDNVGFERAKTSGLLSWIHSTTEKEEEIEGYTCRVFNASNVEVVTRTRVEHLNEEDRARQATDHENKPLSFLLGLFEKKRSISGSTSPDGSRDRPTDAYGGLSAEAYLKRSDSAPRIGRPKKEVVRSNAFNASLWLADSFPLKLREQIIPVIDLMAVRNQKFSRLKSFIQLQLPSGFPVRISIPLFHMINAQVTFKNVNEPGRNAGAFSTEVAERMGDEAGQAPDTLGLPLVFSLDPSLFIVPQDFTVNSTSTSLLFDNVEQRLVPPAAQPSANNRRYNAIDVDDDYVYLLDRFMTDEQRDRDSPETSTAYQQQMQMAIAESLAVYNQQTTHQGDGTAEEGANVMPNDEELLERALEISRQEEEQRKQLQQQEEEELLKAIELSKIDN